MLELRPTCEHCNMPLPPDAVEARICSYECTFCANCVETVLQCLPELRRRLHAAPDTPGDELERRQLFGQKPRQHNNPASAREPLHPCRIRRGDT